MYSQNINNNSSTIHGTQPFSLYFNNKNDNIVKNFQNEEEYKGTLNFLDRFKGRIEKIDRNGVKDLMKRTSEPINDQLQSINYINQNNFNNNNSNYNNYKNNLNNYSRNNNSKIILPKIHSFSENNIKIPTHKSKIVNKSRDKPLNTLIYFPKVNTVDYIYARPNVIKVGVNNKNKKKKKNILIEDDDSFENIGYQPYSIKDYNKIMEDFKKNKFNGLGYNNKNKEYKNREIKLLKRNNYSNNIEKNQIRIEQKIRLKSPKEIEKEKLEEKNLNSRRYKANQYGQKIVFNVLNEINQRKRENYEKMLLEKSKEEKIKKSNFYNKYYNKLIDNNKNEYMNNLSKLKESLI